MEALERDDMSTEIGEIFARFHRERARLEQTVDELKAALRRYSGVVLYGAGSSGIALLLALRRAELAEDLENWEQRREEQRAQVRRQLEEWRTSMQELMDSQDFGHRRLLKAFPRLRSIDHSGALERMHRRLEHRKNR